MIRPKKPNQERYGSTPNLAPPVSNMPPAIPVRNHQVDYDDFDDEAADDFAEDWDDYTSPADLTNQYINHKDLQNANKRISMIGNGKKSVNTFMESGGDKHTSGTEQNKEKSTVIISCPSGGCAWKASDDPFTCTVTQPKTQKKLLGIKTVVSFQLTPTFSNIQVSRRFRHFVWLHQRLNEKFLTLAIPPLPDKQLIEKNCKDGETFVDCRLRFLQMWVNRICLHPVISNSEVFQHFLKCTDDKRWTKGKRAAEKDEYIGGNYFSTIAAPPLDLNQAEDQITKFTRFISSMDVNTRRFSSVGEHHIKSHREYFKKEYQKLGMCFTEMAKSFHLDEQPSAKALSVVFQKTGKTYDDIGELHSKQPTAEMSKFLECNQEYRGILSTFPDCILVQKGACAKVKEKNGKITAEEMHSVEKRAGVVASTVLAEVQHFHRYRITDFKASLQTYLRSQIDFHREITSKLEATLSALEKV